MQSENDEMIIKSELIMKIWNEGTSKAAVIKLTGGADDELRRIWMETIDLCMEQFYESSEEFNEWKQLDLKEKYKDLINTFVGCGGFVAEVESSIDFVRTKLSKDPLKDKENARKIISRAFSRTANLKVDSIINLDQDTELISSEKIAELGITKKSLIDSLNMDPQVKSVECVNGEFIVNTILGEIKFRLVFGDERTGGKA